MSTSGGNRSQKKYPPSGTRHETELVELVESVELVELVELVERVEPSEELVGPKAAWRAASITVTRAA